MVEPGVDTAAAGLHAELDGAVRALRRAVRDDPDALAGTDLQRRAEHAVGQAALLLTRVGLVEIASGASDRSRGDHSGRVMLARDLLVAVDLARRAVAARLSPHVEPVSEDA